MSKANNSHKSLNTNFPINLDDLERYYRLHHKEDNFLDNLLELVSEVEFEKANTWLLKRFMEKGNNPPPNLQARILDLLPTVTNWEAKLHLLQILPYLAIPKSRAPDIKTILLKLVEDKNKFIRAWAYNGLYHLQACHPGYKSEVINLLNQVYPNEAPSVKARIRNIMGKTNG